ncbi:ras and Rab interactor 3 isoform X2 [Rhinatrema bivittatum]|uniref:ras and Rab interactor 3 isoform X2 n=1 Tax=Rhinatrema bivittatum TaxID=194408 RepID=UPI00112BFAC8|nr:ras and Rab interactor 3 isoform X2 [Rhinatrema bivittatum]
MDRDNEHRADQSFIIQHSSCPATDAGGEGSSPGRPAAAAAVALRNCLARPHISVLDRLIRTCPVWLQLCMDRERAGELLQREAAGIFLVRRDEAQKGFVLSVHFSTHNELPDIQSYNIKEEKSLLYLEGSVLIFEDIFKLIAFYCVSRDVLPFTLRLPPAVLEAHGYKDLEIISNLGTGFWDSSLNHRKTWEITQHAKGPAVSNARSNSGTSDQHSSKDTSQCSCEIELSIGSDRLWFVNPIFIEECCNSLPSDELPAESCKESCEVRALSPAYRRPPPPPPLPSPSPQVPKQRKELHSAPMATCMEKTTFLQEMKRANKEMKINSSQVQANVASKEPLSFSGETPKKFDLPSIPPRRRLSDKYPEESPAMVGKTGKFEKGEELMSKKKHVVRFNSTNNVFVHEARTDQLVKVAGSVHVNCAERPGIPKDNESFAELPQKPTKKVTSPPVPPPRKKRLSLQVIRNASTRSKQTVEEGTPRNSLVTQSSVRSDSQVGCPMTHSAISEETEASLEACSSSGVKGSDSSLNCSAGSAVLQTPISEQDSYSTSSTEDDLEHLSSPSFKKSPSVMLDKAKHRLSLVTLTNVFTAFLSADKKMQKKVTELAQDKASYFGNLVQDYKAYSLEMMAKQSSSTEMLQEIRLMMTQLKCYLIQSTELKSIIDPSLYSEDKIEAIVEAALCKCVLKPLKQAIESYLLEIHSDDGALRLLKENQQVIQSTTTTDLGVTTSVPDGSVMEKIVHKFSLMHKAYSPEKKITFLLKSCKLIYESMSTGNPGKPYGADDFLPVLMYVLAHCNLTELLVDVEYMMELMDPSLQLGEGSYYLTTTYGALEHIKHYDKVTVTRQLSVEVQDSIHRWERRRTLNKVRVSRSSVQDFITISLEEPESKARTLATRPDTSTELLCQQCAEKFEVREPQSYGLFVLVDGKCLRLAPDALPHQIKSYLLRSDQKRDFHFLYREANSAETAALPVIKELNFLE